MASHSAAYAWKHICLIRLQIHASHFTPAVASHSAAHAGNKNMSAPASQWKSPRMVLRRQLQRSPLCNEVEGKSLRPTRPPMGGINLSRFGLHTSRSGFPLSSIWLSLQLLLPSSPCSTPLSLVIVVHIPIPFSQASPSLATASWQCTYPALMHVAIPPAASGRLATALAPRIGCTSTPYQLYISFAMNC